MRFGVLGPLVVHNGGELVAIRASPQRQVLAVLVSRAPDPVPVSELIDALWPTGPPANAVKNLQSYISRLKRELGESDRIRFGPAGYTITLRAGELDSQEFVERLHHAHQARVAGNLRRAATQLEQALAMWRGRPYGGLETCESLAPEIEHLSELRLKALEDQAEIGLRLGLHTDLVPKLSALFAAHPDREQFAGLLMLALYRSGRQTKALEIYRRIRARLAIDHGVEPGTTLRILHAAILRCDPAISTPATPATDVSWPTGEVGSDARSVPDSLRPPPPSMVGREAELLRLLAVAEQATTLVVSAVHGMGGVGKTALVRALAGRLRGRFLDGRFEIDLYGFTPGMAPRDPGEVLTDLLCQVGFAPPMIASSVAGKSAQWRGWLAERRVLLILDNARSADQVDPLLPGAAPGCLVVVTSRNRLDELDTSHRLALDTLPERAAVALLRRFADHAAADAGLGEVARLCGYLPLALRAVGPLLQTVAAADLVQLMSAASLRHLEGAHRAVRSAFLVSYEGVDAELQRLLRWCAFHPGPDFDVGSASAIWDLDPHVAAVRLDDLVKANLLLRVGRRFGFHDLFLVYARELAVSIDGEEMAALRQRLFSVLQARVDAALDEFDTQWLSSATAELETVATEAVRAGWLNASDLALSVGRSLRRSGRFSRARRLYNVLLAERNQSSDLPSQGLALMGLGEVARMRGEYQSAAAHYQRCFAVCEEAGFVGGQAEAVRGLADLARTQGEYDEAAAGFKLSLTLCEEIGNQLGQGYALLGLAGISLVRDELDAATAGYEQALRLCEKIGRPDGQAGALKGLAAVCQARGDYHQAAAGNRRALRLYEEIGWRDGQARALRGLAAACLAQGDYQGATAGYRRALRLSEEIGDRASQADAHYGLGNLAAAQGALQSARQAYEKARQIYLRLGMTRRADECQASLTGLGDR